MSKSRSKGIIALVAGSIFSGIFIFVGVIFLSNNQDLKEKGVQTEGICIGNNVSTNSEGNDIYKPIVRFQTTDGVAVETILSFGSGTPEFQEGEGVPLIYLENNPKASVTLNTPFWMETFPWIFLGVGIFINVITVLVFLIVRKRNYKNQGSNKGARDFFEESTDHHSDEKLYDKSDSKDKNPFF